MVLRVLPSVNYQMGAHRPWGEASDVSFSFTSLSATYKEDFGVWFVHLAACGLPLAVVCGQQGNFEFRQPHWEAGWLQEYSSAWSRSWHWGAYYSRIVYKMHIYLDCPVVANIALVTVGRQSTANLHAAVAAAQEQAGRRAGSPGLVQLLAKPHFTTQVPFHAIHTVTYQ